MNEFNPAQRPMPLMGGRPQPSFMDAVKTCLTEKYCCFSGRARRAEFWWFQLFYAIISFALSFVMTFSMLSHIKDIVDDPMSMYTSPTFYVVCIVSLLFLLPNLGVSIRRLHDTNRSGWWLVMPLAFYIVIFVISLMIVDSGTPTISQSMLMLFMYLALLASGIVVLVWLCQDSDRGENRYGRSPKYQ